MHKCDHLTCYDMYTHSNTGHVVRAVAYWLSHYATSRKIVGFIPNVIEFFQFTLSFLGSQPLTEMSTRKSSWEVKHSQHIKPHDLAAIPELTV
jgi:hypothetical protein